MSNPPSFQSTNTVWPAGQPPTASTSTSATSSKAKKRHRARKKPHPDPTPPNPPASTSSAAPAPAAPKPKPPPAPKPQRGRSDGHWRGGRPRGGGPPRGRGGGFGGRGGGMAARGFSTFGGGEQSSASEDIGSRIPFARPGQPGAAPSRRPLHTDSSSSAGPGQGVMTLPPPVGQVRNAQWRANGASPPEDKNARLLLEISLKEGEEGGLETELMRLYETQRPSPEALAAREHLIAELTSWLNEEHFRWGHPHNPRQTPLRIEPFGSVRFGLGTATSDLDLCLLDPYRPNGFVDKVFSSHDAVLRELPDIYNMRRLGRSLERANLTSVQAIADAAVPIVKFKVMIDGHIIEADLNTNERLGVFNSRLINTYCNLHPLVRPLSVFIKFWAKQRGLNNPSGSPTTFSSYALILLVIAYLQRRGLLPNLQSPELIAQTGTEPRRFFSTPKGRSKRYKKIVRSVGWDVTFVEYDDGPPEGYEPEKADLVDLAEGFFAYYGGVRRSPGVGEGEEAEAEDDVFDPRTDIVSIWNGEPLLRARGYGTLAEEQRRARKAAKRDLQRRVGLMDLREQGREEGAEEADAEDAVEGQGARAVSAGEAHVQPTLDDAAAPDGYAQQAQEPSLADQADALPAPSSSAAPDAEPARPASPGGASTSSDPMEYVDYEEPERWSDHLLVVQDPFILTRNCAGNVDEDWVEELLVQMRRAYSLLVRRAPLREICAPIWPEYEAGYQPVAIQRRLARAEKDAGVRAAAKARRAARVAQQEAEAAQRKEEKRKRVADEQARAAQRRREREEREAEEAKTAAAHEAMGSASDAAFETAREEPATAGEVPSGGTEEVPLPPSPSPSPGAREEEEKAE
ncbi:hypothetical protein JCM10207_005741 [Rhodosporidiobolus poonsookiae]